MNISDKLYENILKEFELIIEDSIDLANYIDSDLCLIAKDREKTIYNEAVDTIERRELLLKELQKLNEN